ncbi:MAG: zinc-dependent metalloprotease [Candidatus Aminicenantes bacterium]|nr:zinc-dependent metalloprotease [Candidatus Aminicenantes bacterium]
MKRCFIVLLSLALIIPAMAQEKPQKEDPAKPQAQAAPVKPETPPAKPQDSEPKPYDKVVTPEFKTQIGVFKAHTSKGKLLLEIPTGELGKDFLLVVQIKKSPAASSYPGQEVDDMVVRWELRENKVLLRVVSYANIADPNDPIKKAVDAMNTATIMMAFNVEALAADGSPVIDATKLFTSDVNEIPVKKTLGGLNIDASRTFLDKVRVFPLNLNVEALQTFNPKPAQLPAGFPPQFADMMPSPPSPTAVVHYSFVKLPEKQMMGRLLDNRAPYFSQSHTDYSRPDHETTVVDYIARWRLEKKNPAAAKSEPVKPIVFYVDPATPKKWVPYVKKGIEAWQPAFEEAGFLKAIVAKEAPTPQEDPDWSADDARYSVVRWVPSTTANAMGPHVSDPRSGEILEADVEIYHNVQQLARDWYWVQSGPLDPRVKTLPMPDEVMGDILLYIITHEVGHSLGLPHNFKASALYTIEQIRDKNWVKKNSHVPTLMDYARFNYVAQPEDKIDPKDLIPKIGPYDNFIIKWGYTPIPTAKTPDAEKPTLNEWIKVQDTTPYLRFSTAGTRGTDPGEETEAVGDIDAVKATTLGFKNLQRVIAMLPGATLKPLEDYRQFDHMYQAIWDQARLEVGHVANIIGGYDSVPKAGTAPGVRFTPIAKARQAEAVAFLNANVFKTPDWLLPTDVLRKLEPTSGQARVLALQQAALNGILGSARLLRLQEHEAILGDQAYTTVQMLADLRGGILTEFMGDMSAKVDPYRRNLQRAYVDLLCARLAPPAAAAAVTALKDDSRGAFRAELRTILNLLRNNKSTDAATKIHAADLLDLITQSLDPKK